MTLGIGLFAVALTLLAGIIRGYCGFGFAMIVALGLVGFLPPTEAVPLALLLDLLASATLWRRAARFAAWPRLRHLLAGMVVATLAGVGLVSSLPTTALVVGIALLSLGGALSIMLRREGSTTPAPLSMSRWSDATAGAASGLCMTLASAGGPPLMLYLLHRRLAPAVLRATAILFFAASSTASLIGLAGVGVVGADTLLRAAVLIVPALAGNALGQWLFERSRPRSLKITVAPLLVALSLWVLVREWLSL
ncbi:sulfite exporter TauE/SafE family protein [Salinicola aestuarinus]|uniref:sulfite exporter TauE/SafE family protein n=1 Tax=Salinicola aestuarinus TaxID=1949082 RepID=UPI000DA1991B|nr:sulfite exporter TauE/SafE family protein [Salinicola aestuarinus]